MKLASAVVMLWLHAFSSSAGAAEMCKQSEFVTVHADHPECLFYSGTEKFRERDYAAAHVYWKKLVALEEVAMEFEHLKVSAYNNLGYLYFMGLGVAKNRALGIEHWTHSSKLGHEEAAYHLCHAYGEPNEPGFDPKKAIGYCKESLRRYTQIKDPDSNNGEVMSQLRKYIARLER